MNRVKKVVLGIMMLGMAGIASAQSPQEPLEEVITIETFFPAPWAEFDEMRLYPTTREDSYCDNDRIGYMYYDDNGTGATQYDDAVKVCKGTELGWQELGGGFWTASGNDIYNSNTGNVGIGTVSPGQKLDVVGNIKASGAICDSNGCIGSGGGIPSGAVMYFNLTSCPTEWSALTVAQGRYLVGLPASGTLAGTAGTALSNLENRATGAHSHSINDPGHNHTMSHNKQAAGDGFVGYNAGQGVTGTRTTGITVNNSAGVAGTNAPYIQLLVCQKN